MSVIVADGKVVFIDPGYLGSLTGEGSWVEYTLVPEIIKKTGRLCVDHMFVLKVGKNTFRAIQLMAHKIVIKTLYVALTESDGQWLQWQAWAADNQVMMQSIPDNPQAICRDTRACIIMSKQKRSQSGTSVPFVRVMIDNTAVTIYPANQARYAKKGDYGKKEDSSGHSASGLSTS